MELLLQVERVISFFYYRRAGWNIVEEHLAYPDKQLPDPEFLRKDFETCVLEVNSKHFRMRMIISLSRATPSAATLRTMWTWRWRPGTTGGR